MYDIDEFMAQLKVTRDKLDDFVGRIDMLFECPNPFSPGDTLLCRIEALADPTYAIRVRCPREMLVEAGPAFAQVLPEGKMITFTPGGVVYEFVAGTFVKSVKMHLEDA